MVARLPRNGQGSTVWHGCESPFQKGVKNNTTNWVTGQDGSSACSSWKFDVQHLGKTLPGSSGINPASQKSARRFCRNMSFAARKRSGRGREKHLQTHSDSIYIYIYTYMYIYL